MTKKLKKKKRTKRNPAKLKKVKQLVQDAIELMNEQPARVFTARQLFTHFNIRDKQSKKDFVNIMEGLAQHNNISVVGKKRFQSVKGSNESYDGIVDFVSRDLAYVICEELEDDIRIPASRTRQALHGDLVKVKITKHRRDGRAEGEVVRILERRETEFVGRIDHSSHYAFFIADNRKMHHDIFIDTSKTMNAQENEKVIVKMTGWPPGKKNPIGEVIRVLGPAGENNVEMHAILFEFGLPLDFPAHVTADAEKIPTKIPTREISKRRDMRPITTFTIDPDSAKDFDDALSFQKLENGNIEVGVHIADVSHYVIPKTEIDKEAYKRATSVYLVDRTVPMLPEKLSNNLCSLRPNEDRLAFSAIFELDENGGVHNQWFGRTVIHSDRRLTYEEAQDRIETQFGDYAEEIITLNEIAKKLTKKRFDSGAMGFETREVKFELDNDGKPLRVVPKIRKDAHKLIEEFMLLANKKVAEFIYFHRQGKSKNTMVYRIHEQPDEEKIMNLASFAKRLGYRVDTSMNSISHSLNQLIAESEGKPEHSVLQQLSIRSMAKARYSTDAIGHFGLAFQHYTHFTSPIRRYPDLMVHRLLQQYLDEAISDDRERLQKRCMHSSEMEKRAADAERASVKYKQVEFMAGFLGNEFDAVITGVTEWGIYAEITETACEGMIRLSSLEDDYFFYEEKNHRVVGRDYGETFTLGDKIRVIVESVDLEKRNIDLTAVPL